MQRLLPILLFLMTSEQALADIRLPSIFGSHMVVQQQREFTLWGWAAPRQNLRVVCSWLPDQAFEARADQATLKWSVRIPVPAVDMQQHTIRIIGGWSDIVFDDVMFGEVWICSGQSNMEWQPSWGNVDVTEAQYEAANDPGLRLFTVPRNSLPQPQENIQGKWDQSSRDAMSHFSATAYFFGRMLRDQLGVPVGLINSSWGGTPIESWIPEPGLKHWERQFERGDHPVWNYGRAGSLYNGMIAPLRSLQVKGFLWYQGETNTYNPEDYAALLTQLAGDWRKDFGENTAFYYVQIAPYEYGTPKAGALVRDQQRLALQKIPNSGMVVISDIGNIRDIHPHNKVDVGKRLAALALHRSYGRQNLPDSGPLYRSHAVEGSRIRVQFDYADNPIRETDGPLRGFEIAGPDGVFYPAKAEIDGPDLLVSAPEVAKPEAVRFAFENTSEPNFFNAAGLPASCFRTDSQRLFFPDIRYGVSGLVPDGRPLIRLECLDPDFSVRYTTDGSIPKSTSPAATKPFAITPEQTIQAQVFDPAGAPTPIGKTIRLLQHEALGRPCRSTAASPFKPGNSGPLTPTDGIQAGDDPGDNAWQGVEGTDAEWTIDLGQEKPLSRITVGFLSATAIGIFLPVEIGFAISPDGGTFTDISRLSETVPESDQPARRKEYGVLASGKKARYVRVSAKNIGRIPEWNNGKGNPAWIYIDEIVVK